MYVLHLAMISVIYMMWKNLLLKKNLRTFQHSLYQMDSKNKSGILLNTDYKWKTELRSNDTIKHVLDLFYLIVV